jgi:hypothetical protein
MKRFYWLLFTSLFVINGVFGQAPANNQLVLKVKDQYRSYCDVYKINIPGFQLFETNFQLQQLHKIFPNIAKPKMVVNKFGDTLIDLSLIYEVNFQNANLNKQQVCNQLNNSGWFEYVEPKNTHLPLFVPNDANILNQYYLSKIHAYDGWDISKGDSTIIIGISDTGFDFTHLDLSGSVAYNVNDTIDGIDNDNDGYIDNYRGWDLGANDNNPQITSGNHGLFVSAIAGARANNSIGMAGVGFNSKILPLKITNSSELITQGYESIVYGATHGCSVINCSWGGQVTDGKFGEDVVNFASINCNTLIVAACGNDGTIFPFWPASYPNVLSVSSTDNVDVRSDFSSFGWNVDIAAPGSNIYSAIQGNGYTYSAGTSFSAPMVSACAAIVKSYFTNLSALQIAERLKVTSDDIDTVLLNATYVGKLGRGRLNLYRALTDLDRPSIRYDNPNFSKNYPLVNDTISFYANFKNYLSATQNLRIVMSVVQGNAYIIDSAITVPSLSAFQSFNNQSNPFRFILENNPPNSEIVFKLSYFDTDYRGYEYVKLYANKSYISIDTNNISTTLTGNSRLGFPDNLFEQGEGFNYLQTNQMFYVGGLVLGKNSDFVSDNIYGDFGYDADFQNVVLPLRVLPSVVSDLDAKTVYNDDGAGANKMNIQVTHNIYAWNQIGFEDFIVHSFTLKNIGTASQLGMYAGLFIDWDIYLSSYNKANYLSSSKMMYAWSPMGGKFGGVATLSDYPTNKYAFDNDGSNLSLKINNGFSNIEKYTALTSNRDSAGCSGNGNDISTLLSYGPINLLTNDTITLNFVVMAGNSPQSLINSTAAAYQKMNPDFSGVFGVNKSESIVQLSPNPVKNELFVKSTASISAVECYDILGNLCAIPPISINQNSCSVNVSLFKNGLYVVKVITPNGNYFQKIIVNH